MRTAYSGRAAAYEKKKDYDRALSDHNMVILLCAMEVEILNELQPADRDKFLVEAAQAYRARANCLRAKGDTAAVKKDDNRAADLEAQAKKLASKSAKPKDTSAKEATKEDTDKAKTETTKEDTDKAKTEGESKPAKNGQIRLVNDWTEPVTVVVSGVVHFVRAGEQKVIPRPAGPFSYEVQVRHHSAKGTLEAGKTYTIRIRSQ
jgi:hypothetical protein